MVHIHANATEIVGWWTATDKLWHGFKLFKIQTIGTNLRVLMSLKLGESLNGIIESANLTKEITSKQDFHSNYLIALALLCISKHLKTDDSSTIGRRHSTNTSM